MTRRALAPELRLVDLTSIDAIAYQRVSTDDQAADDKTSLADQSRAITAAAAARGQTIGAWFVDAGVSGATVEKRRELRALIASCEAAPRHGGRRGTVWALNDSRWGRFPDPKEATYWQVHLAKLGWDLRFAEGDDMGDGVGRDVVRLVGAAQASEYRLALQRNTRRGMKGTAEQGFWSRREPYGYRRHVVVGRARILAPGERKADGERVQLEPHDGEAAIVRQMFEAYAAGRESLRSLYRWAVAHAPGRRWSVRAVQIILSNRTYCGDVMSGARCSDPEGYGHVDAHPAIIARALFARVQARLAENRAHPRKPSSAWLASGLVTCPDCGQPYIAGGRGSQRADGSWIYFYADRGGQDAVRRGRVCAGPLGTISRHLLDDALIDLIASELRRPAAKARLARAVDRFLAAAAQDTGDARARAIAALRTLERRRDNLVAGVADGTLERREAARPLADVRAQIDAAQAAVQEMAFAHRRADASDAARAELLGLAEGFSTSIRVLPVAAARPLVQQWLQSATFDKRSRTLTVAIRRVPAVAPLVLTHAPGLTAQNQNDADVVVRRRVIGGRGR